MASFGTSELYTAEATTESFTCPSGTTVLLVGVTDFGVPTGVTYNSTSMTLVGRATSDEGNISVWRLYAPTTGSSQNIVVSGGSFPSIIAAVPVIDGDVVVGFSVANQNDSNPLAVASFTTEADGVAMMLSLAADSDRPVTGYGAGETELLAPVTSGRLGYALSGKDTAGSTTTMSHTKTGTLWWSCGIAVSVSTTGAPPPASGDPALGRFRTMMPR